MSLLADERGSVIGIANDSGAVTQVNKYDTYGVPDAGNAGRFQYTGQAWIDEIKASLPELPLGILPDSGGIQRVPRRLQGLMPPSGQRLVGLGGADLTAHRGRPRRFTREGHRVPSGNGRVAAGRGRRR